MACAGLWYRGRRALWQWLDRLSPPWRRGVAPWNPFKEFTQGSMLADMQHYLGLEDYWGAAAALRHHLGAELPARFFPGVFDETVPLRFMEDLTEEREQILSRAGAVCEGRFTLLGYEELSFGDPVDWHLDPVARRRVPLVHWSRINPGDVAMCGDSRLIWELNRHQWLAWLGESYRLTGETRYAERFEETIRDWIRVNPVGLGINWASSREVAYRVIAWCWALALFWPAAVLTPDLLTLMLDEIRLHALHIDRYVSYGEPPNWALTVEALALLYVGTLFPEMRQAKHWRKKGHRILEQQIVNEVARDGRCRSNSTLHHRRIIEAALHFIVLAERNGAVVSHQVRRRVRALLDSVLPLRRPDGMMMHIGDGDGDRDWLMSVTPRTGEDWRGLFAVAAVVFGNAHYAWAAEGQSAEVLWILGASGEEALKSLAPLPPEGAAPPGLGGYVQMRSGWERQSHQLVFEIGSSRGTGRTGSGDLLSIQCSAFGEPVVVDPGISGPARHPAWQELVQKPAAHSTILVDGMVPGAVRSEGRLVSARQPRAVLRQWCRNERFELADAMHDGYRCLPHPVVHRRRVLFVKRAYWVVIDDLQGAGRHRIDLVFHLAACRIEIEPSLWAKVWTANGPGLAIKPFAGLPLQTDIMAAPGDAATGKTDARQTMRTLRYHSEAEVPTRLVTLLFPLRSQDTPVPAVTPFLDQDGRLSGLTIDDPAVTILYSDHSVTVEAA